MSQQQHAGDHRGRGLKNAICRHSVARLMKRPAVNQRCLVIAQSASTMKSVIGVFSRGPFVA